jgi:molybdate transport system substrate-binding protein
MQMLTNAAPRAITRSPMPRLLALVAAGLLLLPGASSARETGGGRLAVFAAASLTEVLPAINALPNYSFAGSDQLAFQIQQGAKADVFAAASPKYPEALYKQGLVQKPIAFATNSLVVIVPKANPAHIRTVDDLARPGVKVVIGDPAVPVGSYTQTVLKNLGLTDAVMKNVVSKEDDVKSVVAKVALGEADAGFVYVTDVRPVRGKVLAIALRASAQPKVVYEVAVVKGAPHLRAAYRFVTALIRPTDQALLVKYGFGRKPRASSQAASAPGS